MACVRRRLVAVSFVLLLLVPASAHATGEAQGGFPGYEERVLLELTNRARVDPEVELAACGAACSEAACYSPTKPLTYDLALGRAARFHADEMVAQGYFAHDSMCTVVDDIATLYPDDCAGEAACACVGGAGACMPNCTSADQRVGLFGVEFGGEIIASGSGDPEQAFYLWLFEDAGGSRACMFTPENSHRYLLLTAESGVGFGVSGGMSVGDFGGAPGAQRIPSGAHWPREGASIEFWTNYLAKGAPDSARINIDGVCSPMSLGRGSANNGAYTATIDGLAPGCHRYRFEFQTDKCETAVYPDQGSFGIGPVDCPDWSDEPVAPCGDCLCGDQGCGLCAVCNDPGYYCSGGSCQSTCDTECGGSASGTTTTGDATSSSGTEGDTSGGETSTGSTTSDELPTDEGCGCRESGRSPLLLGVGLLAWPRRRRRRRSATSSRVARRRAAIAGMVRSSPRHTQGMTTRSSLTAMVLLAAACPQTPAGTTESTSAASTTTTTESTSAVHPRSLPAFLGWTALAGPGWLRCEVRAPTAIINTRLLAQR
jgi:hypothetical protein